MISSRLDEASSPSECASLVVRIPFEGHLHTLVLIGAGGWSRAFVPYALADHLGVEIGVNTDGARRTIIAIRPGISHSDDEVIGSLVCFEAGATMWTVHPVPTPRGQFLRGALSAIHDALTDTTSAAAVDPSMSGPILVDHSVAAEEWGEDPANLEEVWVSSDTPGWVAANLQGTDFPGVARISVFQTGHGYRGDIMGRTGEGATWHPGGWGFGSEPQDLAVLPDGVRILAQAAWDSAIATSLT